MGREAQMKSSIVIAHACSSQDGRTKVRSLALDAIRDAPLPSSATRLR